LSISRGFHARHPANRLQALVNDRTKFAALLVGITFAVFLMIEMTSLFAGILSRASSTVINIGASIWVMDPAVQTVANTIPVPDYVLDEVRSIRTRGVGRPTSRERLSSRRPRNTG
jgi:hypothetical protein